MRDDPDQKALEDVDRITSTTKGIRRLYFCSSQDLSEHQISKIETALGREVASAFPIVCLGASQLIEAAQQNELLILDQCYGAEIRNITSTIQADDQSDSEKGLRLALLSASADDSRSIREEVYETSLLDMLRDGEARTVVRCCIDLSNSLRLHRPLAPESLSQHISILSEKSLVSSDAIGIRITSAGLAHLARLETEGAARLIDGREVIRQAIQSSIGTKLLDDHFARIWAAIEELLARYFMARGDALVVEISNLLELDSPQGMLPLTQPKPSLSFLEELAEKIAETTTNLQQAEELKLAVLDLFIDRTGPATEWLVRIAASFMAACALGLESSCSSAIKKLFSRTALVLDTDVVLSLVGEGEPEHEAVVTIVKRWTKIGGKVLLPVPVMEEVAYHAHIAQADFDGVAHRLPGTPEERIHLIENAFVRSFAELLANKKANHRHWSKFIKQYRGSSDRDWAAAFETIAGDYTVGQLPPRSVAEADLARQIQQYLVKNLDQHHRGDALRNAKDKALRDAEVYAALVHYRKNVSQVDTGAGCLLVSSAKRLAKAESHFHLVGEQQLVISVSGILYILSMLPDVSFGLSSMKAFLFDERRRGFSSELEKALIRLVRASNDISMPWARRGGLMRSVRQGILRDADQAGLRRTLSDKEIEHEALLPANAPRTATILREALKEAVIDTKLELEASSLRARVKELERELADEKSRRNRK